MSAVEARKQPLPSRHSQAAAATGLNQQTIPPDQAGGIALWSVRVSGDVASTAGLRR